MSPFACEDPPFDGRPPTPPLLRVLGAITEERRRGGAFTCCSAETMDAPGVRAAVERLGYRLQRHSEELWLVEAPPAARPAVAA